MSLRKICIFSPSLPAGGTERVIATLANGFSGFQDTEVHLILFLSNEVFYDTNKSIIIHSPNFNYRKYPLGSYIIPVYLFIRKTLKEIQPLSLLSFGSKYNSFVLLAALRLDIRTFISDRSQPNKTYGKLQALLNPLIYRLASGIIAQTSEAKKVIQKSTKHKNILVIPNPVSFLYNPKIKKEKIILNVGRFIKTKGQYELIEIYNKVRKYEWQLIFIGDGEQFNACTSKVKDLGLNEKVQFLGTIPNVQDYYHRASIFAFTSVSEGFPNSLAEAMSAGCACISYNCVAGPSEIIDNGENGFLVEINNVEEYASKLEKLIQYGDLRERFGYNAKDKMRKFDKCVIVTKTFDFINS
jgi:GalNAc-alpha-(1->4)-GalNAc-alpha-(1->3)-diNAcBac-PP-undecaprenol alpha-1,4-N-acetyl-D-galactosaminyltransferase